MSILKPRPIIPLLIKPIVPAWVLIAAIAAQYAITAVTKSPGPECTINVQQIHESTYSRKFTKLKEVKLKISTACNSPQNFTSLDASIEEVTYGKPNKVVKRFIKVVQFADPTNQNVVLIENLTASCLTNENVNYLGAASGEVHLKDGRVIPVSGSSNEPRRLKCQISAR
jgi:hypothetical protein